MRIQMPDSVAGLPLTQAFKRNGKTKRLLQEQRTGRQFHIRRALGVAGHEEHLDFRLQLNHLVARARGPGTTTSLTRTAIRPGYSLARARTCCEKNASRTMKPDSRRSSPMA
jgi:hypothetical protein